MKKHLFIFLIIGSTLSCSTDTEKKQESKGYDSVNNKSDSVKRFIAKSDTVFKKAGDTIKTNDTTKIVFDKTVDGIKIIKILSEGETIGKFNEIEIGDYGHFNITKSNGKFESYYIIYKDKRIDENFAYGKYDGRKVKVLWQKVEAHIKQSGNYPEVIDVIKSVELLN